MITNKVSVIIPVYNEKDTLPKILERVQAQKPAEIIIVDDNSNDGTEVFLKTCKAKNIKILSHGQNLGKGAAIKTALKTATQEIILIQDADLEYDPADYDRLLQPIAAGQADVVYGSRFVGSSPHRVMFFWHYLGNKFLTLLTNILANLNLTDIETGYKVFRKEALQSITLEENDFCFEPEVTIKLANKNWRFYEVGVSYYGRSYAEGKKIRWTDGLKAIWAILKHGLLR